MDSTDYFAQSRLLWTPAAPERTRIDALRRAINHRRGLQLKDYYDLHDYSVRDYTFWIDLWEFLGIVSSVPPDPSRITGPGRAPYLPSWFPGARLNYAENLLGGRGAGDDGIAISYAREGACAPGDVRHVSWRELGRMVKDVAAGLRATGVVAGDRVALILTNNPTAVAFALGAAAVGAVVSPTAPDMGAPGVLDRYRQIRPKLLLVERSYRYAGKRIDLMSKWLEVVTELKKFGLERVVLVPGVGDADADAGVDGLPMSITYKDFMALGAKRPVPVVFEQLPFDHPLYILYSSGTSGPPKCIVHSAGGVLLQNVKDCAVTFGMGRDDTYFQFTTVGWMMWPFMLAALGVGARIIAYDGSPFYPDVRGFLKFISEQRISHWGTSPRFLAEVQKHEINPLEVAPFESLRVAFVTGAVLTPPQFEWAQRAFGPRVQIASGSGGTDICGGFVDPVETLPVYAGEIQGKALGLKVEIFDEAGRNIEDTGVAGELVCTRPHPSLPLGFWGDDDGEKLRKAYFDMYPGVWRQGDFMVKNPRTKGLIILGRSDGVLNPSGVRFGSAEIYAVLDAPPAQFTFASAIADALCVGQRRAGRDTDERVFLFLKMQPGHRLTRAMASEVREAVRVALSVRHVPKFVFEVADIPYTVNNKKVELAVKKIISDGKAPASSATVANPGAFQEYFKFFDVEALMASEDGQGPGARAKL